MAPNLSDGDLVHIVPRVLNVRGFERGTVVVVRGWQGSDRILVKRVVGLPGEQIRIGSDGSVSVNDAELREPYLGTGAGSVTTPGSQWLCGDDEYFLMGDNRADSGDSRRYGPAACDSIIGKVWLRWTARRARQPAAEPSA